MTEGETDIPDGTRAVADVNLAGGVPLVERRRRPRPDGEPAGDRARRRLDRWRAQRPFDEPPWWRARLDADGLDEPTLLALLDTPAEPETDRWYPELDPLVVDDDGGGAGEPDPPLPDGLVLAPVVLRLLRRGHDDLVADLLDLTHRHPDLRLDVPAVARDLLAPLAGQFERMLGRVLVLELHLDRLRGELVATTAEARFTEFVGRFADAARRRRLLTDYPVLAHQLAMAVQLWRAASRVLVDRLGADWPDLEATFAGGRPFGTVVGISTQLGDSHAGGRSVAAVHWSCGRTVVYKPRPVTVDVHFQQLLGWVNDRHRGLPLRTLRYLARQEYGWAEFVQTHLAGGPDELRRFYRRHGGLLALLYVLNASDFHAENLLAAGEHPVLVDLESLLQPGLPRKYPRMSAAEALAADQAQSSVLNIGLLPFRTWQTKVGNAVDLSGLGSAPGRRTPMAVPVFADPGTDQMRIRLERVEMGTPKHRPVADDAALRIMDYADDIVTGFTEMYGFLLDRRDELLAGDGPLARFADDPVRVLLRATVLYGTLLQTGFHPDLLRDGLDRERHFDHLWRLVPEFPALAACIAAERRDLWRGDIPLFSATAGSTVLRDSDGRPVPGFELRPGTERVAATLRRMGPDDLAQQVWLIRGALGTTALDLAAELTYTPYQPVAPRRGLGAVDAVGAARRLADHLLGIAFHADGSAQWLGVNSARGQVWSQGPLGPDLFHGLTGIALFLGWLGELSGDARYTGAARAALATATRQLDRGVLPDLGGMAGHAGVGYALHQLAGLWSDDDLADLADAHLDRLGAIVAADQDHDFVSGTAGSLAALLAVERHRPGRLGTLGAQCVEHLLAHQGADGGWHSPAAHDRPVPATAGTGWAHGVSGIVWPLLAAGEALGDRRCLDAAARALDHERGVLRDSGVLGRQDGSAPTSELARPAVSWCYGATGVLLSRALCLPHAPDLPGLDADFAAALATVRAHGFGVSHCLCHGDGGSLDVLLTVARLTGDPALRDEAVARAGALVDSVERGAWVCGLPFQVETPGLMVGLAGVGHILLRVATDHVVPSVLALRPAGG